MRSKQYVATSNAAQIISRFAMSAAVIFTLTFMWSTLAHASNSPNDPCLSFLSSGFTDGSSSDESQRTAGVAPAAGKAATLSLLLGVRLALGPTEDLNGSIKNVAGSPDVSALDIQRYRTCKKEQALRVSYLP